MIIDFWDLDIPPPPDIPPNSRHFPQIFFPDVSPQQQTFPSEIFPQTFFPRHFPPRHPLHITTFVHMIT